MATARDIITRSLRELGVVDGAEEVSAEDATASLAVLNDMLAAWELEAIPLGQGAMTLNSDFVCPDSHLEAIRASLSVRLSPLFGRQPSQVVIAQASQGLRSLQNAYHKTRLLNVDPALRWRRATLGRVI
jgi:hypothetical protein